MADKYNFDEGEMRELTHAEALQTLRQTMLELRGDDARKTEIIKAAFQTEKKKLSESEL